MKKIEPSAAWTAVGVILSLIVSILAVVIAGLTYTETHAINRLDLEPSINFSATLISKRFGANTKSYEPSHFIISNTGAVDALQVRVQFVDICFNRETKKVDSYGYDPKLNVVVGTIEPFERREFKLDQDSVLSGPRVFLLLL